MRSLNTLKQIESCFYFVNGIPRPSSSVSCRVACNLEAGIDVLLPNPLFYIFPHGILLHTSLQHNPTVACLFNCCLCDLQLLIQEKYFCDSIRHFQSKIRILKLFFLISLDPILSFALCFTIV